MPSPKIKYQQFSYTVASSGQEITIDVETDKLYNTVTGINILLTDDEARFSTLQMDINSNEVFPDNFEVLRLKFREQAPFGFDYHGLNEKASGSKVKGKYKDVIGASYPYTVTFTLRLENLEPTDAGKING